MKWQEAREQFPDQWLLFWAIDAVSTTDAHRAVNRLAPIEGYADFADAWQEYSKLHRRDRTQELYIYHTSNDKIVIEEIPGPSMRRMM